MEEARSITGANHAVPAKVSIMAVEVAVNWLQ